MTSIDIVIVIVVIVNIESIVVIVKIWAWDGGNILVGSFRIGFFEGNSIVLFYLLTLHWHLAIFYLKHD